MAHPGAAIDFYQSGFENLQDSGQSNSIQSNRNFPPLTPAASAGLFTNSAINSNHSIVSNSNFLTSSSIVDTCASNSPIDIKTTFSLPVFNSTDFFQNLDHSSVNQSNGGNFLIHPFFNSSSGSSGHTSMNVSSAPTVLTNNPNAAAVKAEFPIDNEPTSSRTSNLPFSIEQFRTGNFGSVLPSMTAIPFSTATLTNNVLLPEIPVDGTTNQLSQLLRSNDTSESIGSEASSDTVHSASSVLETSAADAAKHLSGEMSKESSSSSQSKTSHVGEHTPIDGKDIRYYERRLRNNLAAKRSRDNRKKREDSIAIRASFLEKENSMLRTQLAELREETNRLRNLVCQRRLRT